MPNQSTLICSFQKRQSGENSLKKYNFFKSNHLSLAVIYASIPAYA